jgi:hypothetical protein
MALQNSWRRVGVVMFINPKTDPPIGLVATLSSQVIKVTTKSSTRNAWRRAAYMQQIFERAEVSNRVVPLNQETIFELSPLPDQYQLAFTAVYWLPDLTIRVWEYTGEMSSVDPLDGGVLDDSDPSETTPP